jgi:hypothetical protein
MDNVQNCDTKLKSLCLTKHYAMNAYGVSGQLQVPAALPPGKIAHGTHWTGGRVDPRAGLEDMET